MQVITCSFCLEPVPHDKVVVTSPQQTAAICEGCVDICQKLIEEKKAET